MSQQEFLLNLGLDVFVRALADRGLSYREYLANRFALLELIRPEGMGSFKALLQSKGKALEVPLLREEHMPLLQGKYPHYADVSDEFFDQGG